MLAYANDIIAMMSSSAKIDKLIHTLHGTFALKDLGKLCSFLGIEVYYPMNRGMFLSL